MYTHQMSGYDDNEIEFQQRDLQYCPIQMVAYGANRTKRKAAYNCGFALGLVGFSPMYCTVGISIVRYYKVTMTWYLYIIDTTFISQSPKSRNSHYSDYL
jgi:hypothetical protein